MNKLLMSVALSLGVVGFGSYAHDMPPEQEPALVDIVETAAAQENLVTFGEVVMTAELTETFKSEGPFTVFAPSDEAFAALPEGALDELMANKELLNQAVLSHVVQGELLSDAVAAQVELMTASGSTLVIESREDGLYVNEAKIIVSDLKASNGVIHVIDAVMMP